MDLKKLVELYNSRVSSPLSSPEQIQEDIAFLLEHLTGEQIFFSINWLSKFKPDQLRKRPTAVSFHWEEIRSHYELAKAKQERTLREESEQGYDQNNSIKGKNTPTWFGKSFDKHLFE